MQENVEQVVKKYVMRRSRAEVVKYFPEMEVPDVNRQIIKLELNDDERKYYEELLLNANLTGAFKNKSENMLATLNKAREACGAIKKTTIPSTKVTRIKLLNVVKFGFSEFLASDRLLNNV
jgi:hypothetical protein